MQSTKVNFDLLHKLLRDNKNAIRKALELFVETTVEDMRDMEERIQCDRLFEASRIAHSLKSRFVYLGNDDACNKVRTLEGLLKDGRESTFAEIKALYGELNSIIHLCLEEVEAEVRALED